MHSSEIIAALDPGNHFPPGKRIHGEYFCFDFIGMSQMYQYNESAQGWVCVRKKHKKKSYHDLVFLRQS